MWWKRIAASGDTVRINAPCVSACTMVLGIVPSSRICITARAKFGIHMVTVGESPSRMKPSRRETRYFVRQFYPAWLQAWLKTQPKLKLELLWLRPKDIGGHLKRCK